MYSQRKRFINIIYYPIFLELKNILSRIHFPLTSDRKHSKIFEIIPIIGFKKGKSLKDILLRVKVSSLKSEKGLCGPCNKTICEICKRNTKTHQFE